MGAMLVGATLAVALWATPGAADHDLCDPSVDPSCDPSTTSPPPTGQEPASGSDPGSSSDIFFDESVGLWFDMSIGQYFDPDTGAIIEVSFDDEPIGADQPFFDPELGLWFDPISGEFFDPDTGETVAVLPTTVPGADATFDANPTGALSFAASRNIGGTDTRTDTTDDVSFASVSTDEAIEIGAGRMLLVMDALSELGAFDRSPVPWISEVMRDLQATIPSDGLDAEGYRDEVARFARDLPELLELLSQEGRSVSPLFTELLDELDEERLRELDEGETAILDSTLWMDAFTDLLVRGGAEPEPDADTEGDRDAVVSYLRQFESTSSTASTDASSDSNDTGAEEGNASTTSLPAGEPANDDAGLDDGAGSPLVTTGDDIVEDDITLPILAFMLAIAAMGGGVYLWRRRRRTNPGGPSEMHPVPTPAPTPAGRREAAAPEGQAAAAVSLTDLLDASRRMTSSLDAQEIASIAIDEACHLAKAEGGAVLNRSGNTLVALREQPQSLFTLDDLDRSSLRRVLETGRSTAMVATDEPVLVDLPMALAAVPIVADGVISGVLAVVRVASRPFDRGDLDALEMLAPLVGSALAAAQTHDTATELLDTEPMTGLMNRRRLDADLAGVAPGELVSYVMLDIDHFKNFNDVNGHAAGDEALRRVGSILSDAVRPGDVVYRYGGEEFCVLLPGTEATEAMAVAERARAAVESDVIPGGENQPSGRVTVSIGVADTVGGPLDDLVVRADRALYAAKESGRNQVRCDA